MTTFLQSLSIFTSLTCKFQAPTPLAGLISYTNFAFLTPAVATPHHTFTALCQTTTAKKILASKLVVGLGNCVKQLIKINKKRTI
jgi:hypothetical protein